MSKRKKSKIKWEGIILIVLAIAIFYLRPFKACSWYNLVCQGVNPIVTILSLLISGVLLIFGIWRLLK